MNKTINPASFLHRFEEIFQIHNNLEHFFSVNVLFNHPGETRDTYLETFNHLKELIKNDNSNIAYFNLRLYHHFPGTITYKNIDYFNKEFGTVAYCPDWWKNEDLLKNGPYCVKPSHNLSLSESIDIYTEQYKKLNLINLEKLKLQRPQNFFQKALEIKNELHILDQRKEEKLNFLKNQKVEMILDSFL